MKEIELYRPMIDGAISEGWSLYRIADGSFGRKPADCGGIAPNGFGVLLEIKLIKRRLDALDCFPRGILRFNQEWWLKKFSEKGFSLIAMYYEEGNEMHIYCITDARQLELPTQIRDFVRVTLTQNEKGRWIGWNQLL